MQPYKAYTFSQVSDCPQPIQQLLILGQWLFTSLFALFGKGLMVEPAQLLNTNMAALKLVGLSKRCRARSTGLIACERLR